MGSEITWSPVSLDLGWGHMAGKSCVVGGGVHTSGLRILGVHGWLDNANSFDTLAPYLPCGVKLLVLDLPGHGHSDHLPAGAQYDLITYVLHLRRAMDKVGWDRFVILGHSLGGGITTFFTALFPKRVMAIITLDSIIFRPMTIEDLQMNVATLLKGEVLKKQENLVYSEQQAIERLISARGEAAIDADAAYILLPRSAQQVEGGYMWSHDHRARARLHSIFTVDGWRMIISSIKCPVLIVAANQGICTPPVREAMKGAIEWFRSNAQWFELAPVDGSHHVHLTYPERVAKPLVPFLQRVALEAASPKPLQARL